MVRVLSSRPAWPYSSSSSEVAFSEAVAVVSAAVRCSRNRKSAACPWGSTHDVTPARCPDSPCFQKGDSHACALMSTAARALSRTSCACVLRLTAARVRVRGLRRLQSSLPLLARLPHAAHPDGACALQFYPTGPAPRNLCLRSLPQVVRRGGEARVWVCALPFLGGTFLPHSPRTSPQCYSVLLSLSPPTSTSLGRTCEGGGGVQQVNSAGNEGVSTPLGPL